MVWGLGKEQIIGSRSFYWRILKGLVTAAFHRYGDEEFLNVALQVLFKMLNRSQDASGHGHVPVNSLNVSLLASRLVTSLNKKA